MACLVTGRTAWVILLAAIYWVVYGIGFMVLVPIPFVRRSFLLAFYMGLFFAFGIFLPQLILLKSEASLNYIGIGLFGLVFTLIVLYNYRIIKNGNLAK